MPDTQKSESDTLPVVVQAKEAGNKSRWKWPLLLFFVCLMFLVTFALAFVVYKQEVTIREQNIDMLLAKISLLQGEADESNRANLELKDNVRNLTEEIHSLQYSQDSISNQLLNIISKL